MVDRVDFIRFKTLNKSYKIDSIYHIALHAVLNTNSMLGLPVTLDGPKGNESSNQSINRRTHFRTKGLSVPWFVY